jgi:hypothetical protein
MEKTKGSGSRQGSDGAGSQDEGGNTSMQGQLGHRDEVIVGLQN